MFKAQTEMEAIAVSAPSLRRGFNPVTMDEDMQLGTDAEMHYKRKPPSVRLIMCGR